MQKIKQGNNNNKSTQRCVILKRAEETSKIINDVFRKLRRKKTEIIKPDGMIKKKGTRGK